MKIKKDQIFNLNSALDVAFYMDTPDEAVRAIDFVLKECKEFKTNVFVIAKTFSEACFKARKKLCVPELIKEINNESGVFMPNDKTYPLAFYYTILNDINYCAFTIFGDTPTLMNFIGCENGIKTVYQATTSDGAAFEARECLAHVHNILLFKKYSEVEIIHSMPGERKNEMGINYTNLSKLPVQFLDCRWFKELVNSNQFNVSGHFRLQPYKDTKKIIWIDEFKKDGYHRKAKINNQ